MAANDVTTPEGLALVMQQLDKMLMQRLDTMLMQRLDKIEATLAALVEHQTVKDWYSTEEVASLLGKAEFTVREWCRLGRIRAEKRAAAVANTSRGLFPTPSCNGFNGRDYCRCDTANPPHGGLPMAPITPPSFPPSTFCAAPTRLRVVSIRENRPR